MQLPASGAAPGVPTAAAEVQDHPTGPFRVGPRCWVSIDTHFWAKEQRSTLEVTFHNVPRFAPTAHAPPLTARHAITGVAALRAAAGDDSGPRQATSTNVATNALLRAAFVGSLEACRTAGT